MLQNSTSVHKSIFMAPTSTKEINNITAQLKNKCSSGLDEIPTTVIKKSIGHVASHLSYIFNNCMANGVFPDELKKAKVIPIFKKGDPRVVANYRPISILPVFSKVFESIIKLRITDFFKKHDVISDSQGGFTANRSTSYTINRFLSEIIESIKNDQSTVGFFCDLTKAFDCMDHIILLEKCAHYGIRGVALNLIKSYLENRSQIVEVKQLDKYGIEKIFHSKPEGVKIGVPQGSILGPLLFIIFINDLPHNVKNAELYADDTSLLAKAKKGDLHTLKQKSEKKITDATLWFSSNKLILNNAKTISMSFLISKEANEAVMPIVNNATNVVIENVKVANFLGLIIDNRLKWGCHIDALATKLSRALFSVRSIRKISDIDTTKLVYYANIESRIRYGLEFWGSTPKSRKIFVLQKKAIRIMFNKGNRVHCKPLFRKLNIFTLYSLYILQITVQIKIQYDRLQKVKDSHQHFTRNGDNLNVSLCKTATMQLSPEQMGIKIFNKLPINIKHAASTNMFKERIKLLLMDKACYSVKEFIDCLE
jgi:hypothetical protein